MIGVKFEIYWPVNTRGNYVKLLSANAKITHGNDLPKMFYMNNDSVTKMALEDM